MQTTKKWYSGWFDFTTKELVVMGLFVGFTAVVSAVWVQLLGAGVFGPFRSWVGSYGFNICALLVLYFVPKPGAVVLVKFLGGVIEILLGNPFGPIGTFYGTVEGLGFALAFVAFGRVLSFPMIFGGAVLAWLFAAPMDAWVDKVPLTPAALLTYFGPGFMGRMSSSVLAYLTLLGMRKAGIAPVARLLPEARRS